MTAVIEALANAIFTQEQAELDALVLEKVKAGIELLKKEHGADFADHIDLGKLDLRSGAACALGQLYGTYDTGAKILFGEDYPDYTWKSAEYGFWVGDDVEDEAERLGVDSWKLLDKTWKRELAR